MAFRLIYLDRISLFLRYFLIAAPFLSPSAPTFSLGARDSVRSVLESWLGLMNRLKPDSMGNSHGQTLSRNISD